MNSATDYGVVLVTASSNAEATAIAQTLVQEKLAACVNCLPVTSIYTWEETLHQEQEWQLFIKTRLACYPALEARIRELHSYEVPEIIAIPLQQGSASYLQWLADNTRHL
jgi:periplasmic divalent cation tolerance protein